MAAVGFEPTLAICCGIIGQSIDMEEIMSNSVTLSVGDTYHLRFGKDRIVYAGMSSENVFSIVQMKWEFCLLFSMVGDTGFEPVTSAMQGQLFQWSFGQASEIKTFK